MANDHSDDSKRDFSPEEMLKPTKIDAAHKGVKTALATIPVFGGLAAEVFDSLVIAPVSKRRDEFLIIVYDGLKRLEEKVEGFSMESLAENETFHSTMIQATQAAVRTHQIEKRKVLRNAVLNSALSNSPDDDRQSIFVGLCNELSELHIRILRLFETQRMPSIDLDDADWRMNFALTDIAAAIESVFPELQGRFPFYIQIIDDLHGKGLIVNKVPQFSAGMMAKIHSEPTVSPFATEFLAFLQSPLDD